MGRLGRLALATLIGLASAATATATEPGPEAALLAPSERLRTFALGRVVARDGGPPALVALLREDLVRQGFYLDAPGLALIDRHLAVAPVVGYDSNINGGLPNRELDLPGITLVTTPDFAAKAGVVVGARLDAGLRLGFRPGGIVDATLEVEPTWSPRHRIGRTYGALSLCLRSQLRGWTFLDLCQNASVLERNLGRSTASDTTLGLARLFAFGPGLHEVSAHAARRLIDGDVQPAAVSTLASVWPWGASRLRVTLAAPVEDRLVQRRRVALELRRPVAGHPVYLEVAAERADGGRFLGAAQEDTTRAVSLGLPLWRGAVLQVGFARTRSSIPFFDEDRFGISLRLEPPF